MISLTLTSSLSLRFLETWVRLIGSDPKKAAAVVSTLFAAAGPTSVFFSFFVSVFFSCKGLSVAFLDWERHRMNTLYKMTGLLGRAKESTVNTIYGKHIHVLYARKSSRHTSCTAFTDWPSTMEFFHPLGMTNGTGP